MRRERAVRRSDRGGVVKYEDNREREDGERLVGSRGSC